ncbi:hypothetical protein [Aliarcobacter butzleri]|uniref:hypothetical protein n=1 Tax=Aliarcobacter butzleri TaxID=28197 RepID=UPI001EDBDD9C|nr:hypothetical protein [Aliarcobacter butzleri]MCG3684066.1 hypothetical protein [Aliarcobacter butzleri]
MRVLTQAEMKEFEITFDYLNNYIGGFADWKYKKTTIYDLKINGMPLPNELLAFSRSLEKLNKVDELNMKFDSSHNSLAKINLLFNDSTEDRKKIVMQRLINYCFKAKVQPHKLRVEEVRNGKYYFVAPNVVKKDEPIVAIFDGNYVSKIEQKEDDHNFYDGLETMRKLKVGA